MRVKAPGRSLAELEARSSGSALADAVAVDALIGPNAVVDAPAEGGAPEASAPEDGGASTVLSGHGATSTFTRAKASSSTDLALSLDGGMLGAGVSHTAPGHSRGVDAVYGADYLSLDASVTEATGDGGAKGRDVMLELTSGSLGLGGGSSRTSGELTRAGWGSATLSAERSVADLGPAEGGGRVVELSSSRGGSLWGTLGAITGALGLGGSLSYDRTREVTYRTTLPEAQAREVLFEGGGVLGVLRDKARALGLVGEKLAVPDLMEPEAMKPGDALTVGVTGSLTGGVAVRAGVVRLGAQALVEGRFELAATKISATQVELVIAPREVRGLQLFTDTGTPLAADASTLTGSTLRQGFIFDLGEPRALAAYRAALEGRLPAGLSRADLGPGVQRLFTEEVRATVKQAGAGIELGPITSGGLAGLSARAVAVSERRVLTDGVVQLEEDAREDTLRREVLLSGTESQGISSGVRHRVVNGERELVSLSLRAHFEDSRVNGTELNREVKTLNDVLGLSLAPFTRGGRGRARSIDVGLELTPHALDALAQKREAAVRDEARRAGVPGDDAWALVRGLATLDAGARAAAVQQWVQAKGLAGLGTLHRLLGEELDGFSLSTGSGAATEVLERAAALAFQYPNPMQPHDGGASLVKRFTEIGKRLAEVREARADAAADPLLDAAARAELLQSLDGAQRQLQRLCAHEGFGPDEVRALREELGGDGVRGAEARLLTYLAGTR